jgi:hypothetical protein
MNEMSTFIKETWKRPLPFLPCEGAAHRCLPTFVPVSRLSQIHRCLPTFVPVSRLSQMQDLSQLDAVHPSLQNCENKFLLLISHPDDGVLLQQPHGQRHWSVSKIVPYISKIFLKKTHWLFSVPTVPFLFHTAIISHRTSICPPPFSPSSSCS